ncbi:MAG: hypothetical protein HOL51_18985 [Gemmatimonadetes bacterium]|jgi:hypothetical protein|nr:hypothetical protein [Gemmatimonadota bacterium]MDE0962914.1 hypothetical protein [Candidatus Latescibacterota bacterium]MBT5328200.1 hypothetical protein [Gemmatimonadota bacterium]MBT5450616.1 hypothetical protein [Gemmatimonadota bacterium]MBT5805559.1 hypothetical protein [Gemmatimonadota bacterium]|tara:strand:- start:285 stop:863 length:579 start_codon:yes stop_codon:yes gene_type:complete
MKRSTVLVACLCLVLQPLWALAEPAPIAGADTRVYLADGSLVEGTLVEKSKDLVILRVKKKIFTFDKTEIDKIVTLESLGGGAKSITVTEFPYISFLGGAVAFSLISWLQFDRASGFEDDAKLNRLASLEAQAIKFEDKASRARKFGIATALFAAGSLGVSFIPRKATRRIFPEISLNDGEPSAGISYVYRF